MGMFDTILLQQPVLCNNCEAAITSVQTKAFESLLANYRIGDCIAHAEELRIVQETLYCDHCRNFGGQTIYLVVYRGILTAITMDLATAQAELQNFHFEKLILWYHDLYAQMQVAEGERRSIERFLNELHEWYAQGYDKDHDQAEDSGGLRRLFVLNASLFQESANPLDAIARYLTQQKGGDDEMSSDEIGS